MKINRGGKRGERHKYSQFPSVSGKKTDRAVDVSVHSLLVEPRRHSELFQAVVNALHPLMVVAPELVIGPVVREEDFCQLRRESR